jgi:hypothetical protein
LGAVIGTGYCSDGPSTIANITICNSTIIKASSVPGAVIGGGFVIVRPSTIGTITICNSAIIEASSYGGAVIGTGNIAIGTSTIANIAICNSTIIEALSDGGVVIGTGHFSYGTPTIGTITIWNSTIIEASSEISAVIGAGSCPHEGDCSTIGIRSLVFSGCSFIECNETGRPAIFNVWSILFSAASLTFIANNAPLFETSPSSEDWFDLMIGYRQVTTVQSERLSSLSGPFVHIGNINVSASESDSFGLCIRRNGHERCFDPRVGGIRSMIVGTPGASHYSFPGWIDGVCGTFAASNGALDFLIDSTDSFIEVLSFMPGATCQFVPSATFSLSGMIGQISRIEFSAVFDATRAIDLSSCHSGKTAHLQISSPALSSSTAHLSPCHSRTGRFVVSDIPSLADTFGQISSIWFSAVFDTTRTIESSSSHSWKTPQLELSRVGASDSLFDATASPSVLRDFLSPLQRRNRVWMIA